MVAPMVAASAPHPVSANYSRISHSQIQRLARTSYPVNHMQRGLLYKQSGNQDEALIEFLKSVQENPLQVKAYYEQALIFKQRGYTKLAQSALQQAVAIKPDYKDARVLLASIYLESGALSEAAQELFKSLGLASSPSLPRTNAGTQAFSRNQAGAIHGNSAQSGVNPGLAGSAAVMSKDSGARGSLPVMQTPHGHLFSPLSALSGQPRRPAGDGSSLSSSGIDAFAQRNGLEQISSANSKNGARAATDDESISDSTTDPSNAFAAGAQSGAKQAKDSSFGGLSDLLRGIPGIDPQAGSGTAEEQHDETNGFGDGRPVDGAQRNEPSSPTRSTTLTSGSTDESVRRQVDALVNQAQQSNEHRGGFRLPNIFSLFRQAPAPTQAPVSAAAASMSPGGTMIGVGQPSASSGSLSAEMQNAQVAKMMQAAKHERNKHHVAGWVGSIKEDKRAPGMGSGGSKFDMGLINSGRHIRNGGKSFNPVDMFVRQSMPGVTPGTGPSRSTVSMTETLPEGIGTPESIKNMKQQDDLVTRSGINSANEKLPPTGVRVETITAPVGTSSGFDRLSSAPFGASAEPKADGGSWFTPPDFSKMWHRAFSWVTFPSFKPFAFSSGPAPTGPTLVESGFKLTPASPLSEGSSPVATVDSMSHQSQAPDSASDLQAGNLAASGALSHGASNESLSQPAAGKNGGGFDAVLSMLPKEITAGLQNVWASKPAEVATAQPSSKPQSVDGNRPDAAHVPSSVPGISQGVLDNLVSARVGADALAENDSSLAPPAVSPTPPVPVSVSTPSPMVASSQGTTTWEYAKPYAPQLQLTNSTTGAVPSPLAVPSRPAQEQPDVATPAANRGGAPLPVPALPASQPPPSTFAPMARPSATRAAASPQGSSPLAAVRSSSNPFPQPMPISSVTNSGTPQLAATASARAGNAGGAQPSFVGTNTTVDVQPMLAISANSRPVAQRLAAKGFKFVAPSLSANQHSFVSNLQAAKNLKARTPVTAPLLPPEPPEDHWAKRMKYLLANGTSTLNAGEAFMFSEETGEGVLFLGQGNTVRRKIAAARDAQEVAQQRRPDTLVPKGEMQYNLSLLGKIIKPQKSKAPAEQLPDAVAGAFTVDDLLGKSQGFLGWLKGVFNAQQKK
jgi:hypothetical protein